MAQMRVCGKRLQRDRRAGGATEPLTQQIVSPHGSEGRRSEVKVPAIQVLVCRETLPAIFMRQRAVISCVCSHEDTHAIGGLRLVT